jgi:hypothetical protein
VAALIVRQELLAQVDVSSAVTLAATVVVALATVVYAALTYSIQKANRSMAEATRAAAQSAALSAASAAQSVSIAEASTVVQFVCSLVVAPPRLFVEINPVGASVYVHRVAATITLARQDSNGVEQWLSDGGFEWESKDPSLLTPINRVSLDWNDPQLVPLRSDRTKPAVTIDWELVPGLGVRQAFVEAQVRFVDSAP